MTATLTKTSKTGGGRNGRAHGKTGLARRRTRPPRLRSMRQFAEEEIIIPTGPDEGRRFRCDRQPVNGLWFDAVDSGRWTRFVATGPGQASKSLVCFIIPTLYHLFEYKERIILALPDMSMAGDKWKNDLLPVIRRTRYAQWLPEQGPGSRGGIADRLDFGNGASIRFMTGGGGDKSRAGYTARVVVFTEWEGFAEAGAESQETDKISQIIARTRRFGHRARIYAECTLTTEEGRTWQEISKGTDSRIELPCSHCKAFVLPGREQVTGWEDADNIILAGRRTAWHCPECGRKWSEVQRRQANLRAVLVHRGQKVRRKRTGRVVVEGKAPDTHTLGFRWQAVHNLFLDAAYVGQDLWEAARSNNEEDAEKKLCQFVFAVPYQPPKLELSPLKPETLQRRVTKLTKGILPAWTEFVTVGVDVHKYSAYWAALACRRDGTGHVPDYGVLEIHADELGQEQAILVALREFRDTILAGWTVEGTDRTKAPDQVWIDEGWKPEPIKAFCHESIEPGSPAGWQRFRPCKGFGVGQQQTRAYSAPRKTGSTVIHIGEEYHLVRLKREHSPMVQVNADHWKSFLRDRLACPADVCGAMTIYHAMPREHMRLSMHLTAEEPREEYKPGVGRVIKWVTRRGNNHWSDALYNACAAAHLCGVRLMGEQPQTDETKAPRRTGATLRTPDGRPFLAVRR
jgi:hypothetical protein